MSVRVSVGEQVCDVMMAEVCHKDATLAFFCLSHLVLGPSPSQLLRLDQ